jgi:kynurenine formamidase
MMHANPSVEASMRNNFVRLTTMALSILGMAAASSSSAQEWQPPAKEARCPSKWGAADERGALNHQKPEAVLRASKLIRSGEAIELGRVLAADMPVFGTRRFTMIMKRTTPPMGTNQRRSNEETIDTELGQVGTQFDAFPHQTIGNDLYNCIPMEENATRTGFNKMGVDKVGAIFTRGVLIDVAALKGVETLDIKYEITAQDLQDALAKQGVKIEPGDAVLIHTGWGKLWGLDNAKYVSGCPGIGIGAAQWLAKQDVMLLGADNWPVEVAPNPDPKLSIPVHQIALVVNGIHLLENMKLDELAAKQVYEFAFIMQPLKIKGGTGSTVAPIAVR